MCAVVQLLSEYTRLHFNPSSVSIFLLGFLCELEATVEHREAFRGICTCQICHFQ